MTRRQTKRPTCTLDTIAQAWLADIPVGVKESTFTRYHRIVHKYLLPHLGSLPLTDIDCLCINRYTEMLLRAGGLRKQSLAPKTVSDVLCVLKSILKFARLQGYDCPGTDGVRLPAKRGRNIRILSNEGRQVLESMLEECNNTTKIGVLITLFTGLRLGEVCGLKWSDIDLVAQLMYVRRTVGRIADLDPEAVRRTKIIISEPKTASSFRIIPIPSFLMPVLIQAAGNSDTYILTGTQQPMEPHCFYLRYQRMMAKCHLDGYSFHALRHTFATRCVELGFDTKSLSEILGHTNISTTLAFYVHPTIEQKRSQMELLAPAAQR